MNSKYNYIIAGGYGFFKVAYYDLFSLPNVAYYSTYIDGINSKVKQLLIRLNFNLKLGGIFRPLLHTLVYPWLFPHSFRSDMPLCFVFFETQFAVINTGYMEYLRKKYPTAKMVLYMQDIVASLPYYNIESYKRRFDIILSYDKGDCKRYGLIYYPTPYSRIDETKLPVVKDEGIDVFFCGAGKTRYPAIFDIYKKCTGKGLKCKFFLTGVPHEKRIDGEGLVYDHPLSYEENLAYVVKSKCILEIMQEHADGFTPRLWEAIMFDKHLLTNNTSIRESNYWYSEAIHLVSDCGENFEFINQQVLFPEEIKKSKSPVNLLECIENRFL